MADLNNLLGELEEEEEIFYDDDDDKAAAGRPSVETAATELMTSHDWDDTAETPSRRFIDVPVALQEAKRRREDDDEEVEAEEAAEFDFLTGDTAEDGQHQFQLNELCTKLHQFWHQEKHCPELLEYDTDMVEQIKLQMDARQEWIDQALEGVANWNAGEASVQHLLATLAQVDLDRLKYVLANWMAERLAKIEAHPLHMREKVDHLSEAELEYLKEYGALLEDHLRQTVFDHIPEAWQRLDEGNMIDQPDYDGYHFWLVNEAFVADDVEQEEGNCLVAKYSAMREFMREGKVELQL